jgi:hypothetical protein
MPFQTYILLDGLKYKTLAKQWRPTTLKPAQARLDLMGRLSATFAAAALKRWDGIIAAPTTASDGYGSIDDLRVSIAKRAMVSFTDHYGTEYPHSVVLGPFEEEHLQNVWNAPSNKVYVRVSITSEDIE